MSTLELLTVRDVAKILKRGVHFVYRLVEDRKIDFHRDGRRGTRFTREAVDRYINQFTTPATRKFFRSSHRGTSIPGTRYTQTKGKPMKEFPGFSRM